MKKKLDEYNNIQEEIKRTVEKREEWDKMIGLKKIHIDHFQMEKNNLENLINVLSYKIKELNEQTAPLEKKRKELENTVKNAYNELIKEFKSNKELDLKVESYENKIRVINETTTWNSRLIKWIQIRMNTIRKELLHLSQQLDADIAFISKRIDTILENIDVIIKAKSAKEIEEKPLKFPKVQTPPWRTTKDKNDPNLYTEAELWRQRNKLRIQLTEQEQKQQKSSHKSKEQKLNK